MRVGEGVRQWSGWFPSTTTPCRQHAVDCCEDVASRPSEGVLKRDHSERKANGLFSMDPAVVNFGAFAPLEVRSKTLRITNTASTPVRFCILRPECGAFRISFEKKSCLAPGMTQTVTVYFVPPAWKLYKSSLKVIGVPVRIQDFRGTSKASAPEPYVLHHVRLSSFPELRNIRLPRLLNFGAVPLGITRRKTLKLSNPHQVSFQFAVNVVTENIAFSVQPLSGDVSGRSTQVLTISFTPQVRATAFFAIDVHIADFGSKVMHVEAIGTCWRGRVGQADHTADAGDTTGEKVASRAPSRCCTPPQRRDLRMSCGRCDGVDLLSFQPMRTCPEALSENNGRLKADSVPSCTGEMEKRRGVPGQAKCLSHRSSSSDYVREIPAGIEHITCRTGGINAAFSSDDPIRVSHFDRRWKAMARSGCVKTYKSTILGEAPTTELKRQRLLSKRLHDALELLKKHSERDLSHECAALPPETVVVPSRWVPRRVHAGGSHTEVPTSNLFVLRIESVEKFARIVSALIKRIRLLRRLYTLQKALKLRQATITSGTDTASAVSGSFEKFTTEGTSSKKEETKKELRISVIRPQRTTYQELFQMMSTKSSIPSTFLVRSKIEVADVFKSLDNYDYMAPLPPLDYEIMRLPDVEALNPAWHLEPTDRRLVQGLLRHTESINGDARPALSPRCGELKFTPVIFDPPLVNAAHFVAPPTTEFRPLIPLPENVETDLGYCFDKRTFRQTNATYLLRITRRPYMLKCEDVNWVTIQHVYNAHKSNLWCARVVPDCQMSDTDSESHDGSIEIPVPSLEVYVQSEAGDERPVCGTMETITHGELHDSKQEEFVQASAALSESWGRLWAERQNRLNEINMVLPSELKMDLR